MVPLAIRWPPNQSTATQVRFITPMTVGSASANMRFTRSPVVVSAPFASANRCCSWPVRMNARMTRTPVICSRRTRLTRSILDCIDLNNGTALAIRIEMTTSMTGTTTTRSAESLTSSFSAMITPPTHMIGASTMIVRAICRNSWICWTSLVLRVMSEGVPKWLISCAEKRCTDLKTALRMSRPMPMETLEAKYTATIDIAPTTSVMPSIHAPVVQM